MRTAMTPPDASHARHPAYRIRSASRGTEGPLPARAIVDLARIGMLGPEDLIECRPGEWVPAVRSPEVRAAMESRRERGHHLLSSPVAAVALLGLKVSATRLTADERGRAELLAIVSQHPDEEVMSAAVELLASADADGLGELARRIATCRTRRRFRAKEPAEAPWAPGFQREIPRRLGPAGWAAFDGMRRQVDGRGGLGMVWPNGWSGRFVAPGVLPRRVVDADGLAIQAFDLGMNGLAIEQVRAFEAQSDGSGDPDDPETMDLSGTPIGDLDSLPSDIQDLIRRCRRIDLSDTALRSVPAWLFEGKEHVAMLGTPLESLPDVVASGIDPSLHLILGSTRLRRIPESWAACAIRKLDISSCALEPDALLGLPACDVLVAESCGLRSIDGLASIPRVVNFSRNPLGEVPMALRRGSGTMTEIYLDDAGVTDLPAWIMEFGSLQELSLRGNAISDLSLPLGSLASLEEVDLGGNRIASVAPAAFSGRPLRVVKLDGNAIRSLPPIMYPSELLDLSGNPLEWFPGILNDHASPDGAGDADGGPEPAASEDPSLGLMEIIASGTRVRAVPAGFLDLKIRRLVLSGCTELRSLPLNLAASGLLESLDCSGCTSLDRFDAPERPPWASWPEARRKALASGMEESSWCTHRRISIDFGNTGFEEVPPMLAVLGYENLDELALPHERLRSLEGLGRCERLSSISLPALPDDAYPGWLLEASYLSRVRIGGPGFRSIPAFVRALPLHSGLSLELHDLPAVHLTPGGDGAGLLPAYAFPPGHSVSFSCSPMVRLDAGALSSVWRLQFEDVDVVDISGFPEGCDLHSITFIGCREVRIASSIVHCAALRSLDFRDIGLVELPEEVATLPAISSLLFFRSGVRDDIVARIRRARPGLCSVE